MPGKGMGGGEHLETIKNYLGRFGTYLERKITKNMFPELKFPKLSILLFFNMFIHTENDIESLRNTQDINI